MNTSNTIIRNAAPSMDRRALMKLTGASVAVLGAASLFNPSNAKAQTMSEEWDKVFRGLQSRSLRSSTTELPEPRDEYESAALTLVVSELCASPRPAASQRSSAMPTWKPRNNLNSTPSLRKRRPRPKSFHSVHNVPAFGSDCRSCSQVWGNATPPRRLRKGQESHDASTRLARRSLPGLRRSQHLVGCPFPTRTQALHDRIRFLARRPSSCANEVAAYGEHGISLSACSHRNRLAA